jgi:hypothetical protein
MEEGGLVPGFPSDTEIFKYSNLLCKKKKKVYYLPVTHEYPPIYFHL